MENFAADVYQFSTAITTFHKFSFLNSQKKCRQLEGQLQSCQLSEIKMRKGVSLPESPGGATMLAP